MKKYLRLFLVIALSVCLLVTDGIIGGILPDFTEADAVIGQKDASYVLDDDYTASSKDCEELAKGIVLDLGGKVLDLADNKATTVENAGAIVISNGTLKNAANFFASVSNTVTLSNVKVEGSQRIVFNGDVTLENTQIGEMDISAVEVAEEDQVSYDASSFLASALNVSIDAKSVVGNLYVDKTANVKISGFVANLVLTEYANYSYVELADNANVANLYCAANHVYINASKYSYVDNAVGNYSVWTLMTPTVYVEQLADDEYEELVDSIRSYSFVTSEYATCMKNGSVMLSYMDGEDLATETFVVKAQHCYGEKTLVSADNALIKLYDSQCIYCGHMRRTIGENSFVLEDCENLVDLIHLALTKDFNVDYVLAKNATIADFVINGGYIHLVCQDGILSGAFVVDIDIPDDDDANKTNNILVKAYIYDQDVYFYGLNDSNADEPIQLTFNIYTFLTEILDQGILDFFGNEIQTQPYIDMAFNAFKALVQAEAILDSTTYDVQTMLMATLGLTSYLVPCEKFLNEVASLSVFEAGKPDEDGNVTYTFNTTALYKFIKKYGNMSVELLLDELYPVDLQDTLTSEKVTNFIFNIPNITVGEIIDVICDFAEENGVSEEDIFGYINLLAKTVLTEMDMESIFNDALRGDVRSFIDTNYAEMTLNELLGVLKTEQIPPISDGEEPTTKNYYLADLIDEELIDTIMGATPAQIVDNVMGKDSFDNYLNNLKQEKYDKVGALTYTVNAKDQITNVTANIIDYGTITLDLDWDEVERLMPVYDGMEFTESENPIIELTDDDIPEYVEPTYETVTSDEVVGAHFVVDMEYQETVYSDGEPTQVVKNNTDYMDVTLDLTFDGCTITDGRLDYKLVNSHKVYFYDDKPWVKELYNAEGYTFEFTSDNGVYYITEATYSELGDTLIDGNSDGYTYEEKYSFYAELVEVNGETQYVVRGIGITTETEIIAVNTALRTLHGKEMYLPILIQYEERTYGGDLINKLEITTDVNEDADEFVFSADLYMRDIDFTVSVSKNFSRHIEGNIYGPSAIALYHASLVWGEDCVLKLEQQPVCIQPEDIENEIPAEYLAATVASFDFVQKNASSVVVRSVDIDFSTTVSDNENYETPVLLKTLTVNALNDIDENHQYLDIHAILQDNDDNDNGVLTNIQVDINGVKSGTYEVNEFHLTVTNDEWEDGEVTTLNVDMDYEYYLKNHEFIRANGNIFSIYDATSKQYLTMREFNASTWDVEMGQSPYFSITMNDEAQSYQVQTDLEDPTALETVYVVVSPVAISCGSKLYKTYADVVADNVDPDHIFVAISASRTYIVKPDGTMETTDDVDFELGWLKTIGNHIYIGMTVYYTEEGPSFEFTWHTIDNEENNQNVYVNHNDKKPTKFTHGGDLWVISGSTSIDEFGFKGWDFVYSYYNTFENDQQTLYVYEESYQITVGENRLGWICLANQEIYDRVTPNVGEAYYVYDLDLNYHGIASVNITIAFDVPLWQFYNAKQAKLIGWENYPQYIDETGEFLYTVPGVTVEIIYDNTEAVEAPTVYITGDWYNDYPEQWYDMLEYKTGSIGNGDLILQDAQGNLINKTLMNTYRATLSFATTDEWYFYAGIKPVDLILKTDGTFELKVGEVIDEAPMIYLKYDWTNGYDVIVQEVLTQEFYDDTIDYVYDAEYSELTAILEFYKTINNGSKGFNYYHAYTIKTEDGFKTGFEGKAKLNEALIATKEYRDAHPEYNEQVLEKLYNEACIEIVGYTADPDHISVAFHFDLEDVLSRFNNPFGYLDTFLESIVGELNTRVPQLSFIWNQIADIPSYPFDYVKFTLDTERVEESEDWTKIAKVVVYSKEYENSYAIVAEKTGAEYDVALKVCGDTYYAFTMVLDETRFEFVPTVIDCYKVTELVEKYVVDWTDGVYTLEVIDQGSEMNLYFSVGGENDRAIISIGLMYLDLTVDYNCETNILPLQSFFEMLNVETDFEVFHPMLFAK